MGVDRIHAEVGEKRAVVECEVADLRDARGYMHLSQAGGSKGVVADANHTVGNGDGGEFPAIPKRGVADGQNAFAKANIARRRKSGAKSGSAGLRPSLGKQSSREFRIYPTSLYHEV